jgi:hypothetical protein
VVRKVVRYSQEEADWHGFCASDSRRWISSNGSFHDEIAAAQAFDEPAHELFGGYARPNFPDGVDAWLEDEAARLREEVAMNHPASAATPHDQARAT